MYFGSYFNTWKDLWTYDDVFFNCAQFLWKLLFSEIHLNRYLFIFYKEINLVWVAVVIIKKFTEVSHFPLPENSFWFLFQYFQLLYCDMNLNHILLFMIIKIKNPLNIITRNANRIWKNMLFIFTLPKKRILDFEQQFFNSLVMQLLKHDKYGVVKWE